MLTNLKRVVESAGSLRQQSRPGKLRGVPQSSQSSSYRSLRPLAPRAQCAGVKPTIKQRGIQTTDLSRLEVIAVQQLAAIPVPPVEPRLPALATLLEPPRALPEFGYTPCWVNNNLNVNGNPLANASTGNM